ncbi:MAG TPA: exodeoxyribonuclease V subunit gamma [bacterium]|nr:exodeoxyribonuclease V subunit gamma [bacterium]
MPSSSGFFLYQSNMLELLAEKAVPIINGLCYKDPLKKNMTVVQTSGMGRWLSIKIAERSGICANIETTLPENFIQHIASIIFDEKGSDPFFETPNLRWFIYDLLSTEFVDKKELKPVRTYIGKDDVKKYQISGHIADMFDQYQIFRPDIIAKWKKGETVYKKDKDEIWQKEIYSAIISAKPDSLDRAAFFDAFRNKIEKRDLSKLPLPEGVVLFGISTMTAFQLELFKSLSKIMEVHLFHLDPSREFWGNIETTEFSGKDSFFYESDNPLLSELGFAGKNFFNLLSESDGQHIDCFAPDTEGETILNRLQNDIKACVNPKPCHLDFDGSVIINGCWGKMREMEVLKDTLLSLFDSNEDLNPRDVIVMAPQIEEYSDFIEAVFGSGSSGNLIPFTVADRSATKESGLIDPFLNILSLDGTNFSRTAVIAIFENPNIYRKFNVEKEDLESIKKAVSESGIKWGIDKNWRRSRGYHEFEQNSWKFGIDRMLLGYALPGKGTETFSDILPYDDIEGGIARIIAKFISFTDLIFEFRNDFYESRTLAQWEEKLNRLVDLLFIDNAETSATLRYLRDSFNRLVKSTAAGGFCGKVPLSVVREHLNDYFSNSGFGRGFMNGQVTFCSLKPMRSIPFKVIALIGMNDESFPRENMSSAFDLMFKYPRITDRFVKENDKYLFLEALICAREKLVISYIAKSMNDSSKNIPSSVVESLRNYITEKYCVKPDQIEKLHPLQPFCAKYFMEGSDLFSYSERDFCAAKHFHSGSPEQVPGKVSGTVDISRPELRQKTNMQKITVNDLLSFFANPQKYFFRNTLDIVFPYIRKEDDDLELFTFDNLQGYGLKNEFAKMNQAGFSAKDFMTKMRGSGLIPHGSTGRVLLNRQIEELPAFLDKIKTLKGTDAEETVSVDLKFNIGKNEISLRGDLDNVFKDRQVLFRPSKTPKDKDKVKALILHLAMNASGVMKETCFSFMDADLFFKPSQKSREELSDLVEIYLNSMSKIPLFNPWIAEKLFSGNKPGRSEREIFNMMIEKMDDDFGGMTRDIYFDMAARITGFFESTDETVAEVIGTARKIFSKISDLSEEMK